MREEKLHRAIMNILLCEDIDKLYDEMISNNADFRKFVEENRGKSTDELIREELGIVENKKGEKSA